MSPEPRTRSSNSRRRGRVAPGARYGATATDRLRAREATDRERAADRRAEAAALRAEVRADEPAARVAAETWRTCLCVLQAYVPASTYNQWFRPLRGFGARGTDLAVEGPEHVARWVSRRYAALLTEIVYRASDRRFEAVLVLPREER